MNVYEGIYAITMTTLQQQDKVTPTQYLLKHKANSSFGFRYLVPDLKETYYVYYFTS